MPFRLILWTPSTLAEADTLEDLLKKAAPLLKDLPPGCQTERVWVKAQARVTQAQVDNMRMKRSDEQMAGGS